MRRLKNPVAVHVRPLGQGPTNEQSRDTVGPLAHNLSDRPTSTGPLSSAEALRVYFVQDVLNLLHMVEFYELIEYAEVAIPVVHSMSWSVGMRDTFACELTCASIDNLVPLHLLALSCLPIRVYCTSLASAQMSAEQVSQYVALEMLSCLAFCVALRRRLPLGVSPPSAIGVLCCKRNARADCPIDAHHVGIIGAAVHVPTCRYNDSPGFSRTMQPRKLGGEMTTSIDDDAPKCDLTVQDDEDETIEIDEEEEADDTEEDACCICQDVVRLVQQGFLPCCDHRFHFDCIVTWSKVTNLCPLCKLQFNTVTRHDVDGAVVHREPIADTKQVFRPDPRDHDVHAQLQLVNNVRCEGCGRGDDEHVLLMCEAPLCMNASHTYCAGLADVPSHAWYCAHHEGGPQRASDLLSRSASTVSSRRQTRRLATLMSNVMGGVGASRRRRTSTTGVARLRRTGRGRLTMPDGEGLDLGAGRPIRGVALAYATHMSRELQAIQQRTDAMFARGELGATALYAPPRGALLGTRSTLGTRSQMDQIWEDRARSQRQLEAASRLSSDAQSPPRTCTTRTSPNRIAINFASEFRDLAKRMADAASHDNYASSVSLTIPKTARLRLVSTVTAFFEKLNDREKVAALDAGCLGLLFSWLRVGRSSDGGEGHGTSINAKDLHPQVLEAVLTSLEGLPVRKEDLTEVQGFRQVLDEISTRSDISLAFRERCIVLSEKWRAIDPPPVSASVTTTFTSLAPRAQSARERDPTPSLPAIQSFTAIVPTNGRPSGKRKASRPPIETVKKTTKQPQEEWAAIAVDYVKAKLYPLYKDSKGQMSKDLFKTIVKQVLERFRGDAGKMQSAIVETKGDQLTSLAKQRLMQLLDQVYQTSRATTGSSSMASARAIAHSNASYSATPTNAGYSATPSTSSTKRARNS